MSYKSTHTGAQIDDGVSAALNPDATPTLNSTNLVTSGGVAAKLSEKQNTLVFDNAPTNGSNNPVRSGGIYTADAALEQMILASFPTDSISNQPVASFADGADGIPVKALTVNIDPVQEGSGDPSPDNVRPISGWGSVSLGQTLAGYVMPTIEQGGINASGDETTALDRCRSDYVTAPVESGKAFFAVTGNDVRVIAIHRYYADKTRRDRISYGYVKSGYIDISGNNFTIKYLRFVLAKSDGNSNIIPSDIENLVVAPYSSISLGQTVYGGTLTDNGDGTWTLNVTTAIIDLGGRSWTRAADAVGGHTFWATLPNAKRRSGSGYNSCWCAIYKGVVKSAGALGEFQMTQGGDYFTNSGNIAIKNETYTSAADFKTAMDGIMLVYTLATPQTYTITAKSVKTLLGDNNIFADCGDIASLTYRADVGLYIDKKLAEA